MAPEVYFLSHTPGIDVFVEENRRASECSSPLYQTYSIEEPRSKEIWSLGIDFDKPGSWEYAAASADDSCSSGCAEGFTCDGAGVCELRTDVVEDALCSALVATLHFR